MPLVLAMEAALPSDPTSCSEGQQMLLAPSEYEGEHGTAVVGRVVMTRLVQLPPRDTKGKGKGTKKGKPAESKGGSDKCEVHLLGGKNMSDLLYFEAWGDDARSLSNIAKRGLVLKVYDAKVIAQPPKYSTSPLRYHLRVLGPLNMHTKVEVLAPAPAPWEHLPMHHPFVTINDLQKITDAATVCVLGIVTAQPGCVSRQTPYGMASVCNAVVRMEGTAIRCAFWRSQAEALAAFNEGDCIAIYMVKALSINASDWELRGTESTIVEACPLDLVDSVKEKTNLEEGVATLLWTRGAQAVDYNTSTAKFACVSSVMGLLVPGQPRKIEGVWEIHSVTVLGLIHVLAGGGCVMRCCSQCKIQVEADQHCNQHPDVDVEMRWIAKLHIADDTGAGEAMIYHEALTDSGLVPLDAVTPITSTTLLAIDRKLRSMPWSLRLVFRLYEGQQQNFLEVKILRPTISGEGILSTCAARPFVELRPSSPGCPFAACKDVLYDTVLHRTNVRDKEVVAVRLWVRFLEPSDEEETAISDGSRGLRVRRNVRCMVNAQSATTYCLMQSGLSSAVQWLLQAAGESAWLVLATLKEEGNAFVCSGHYNVSALQAGMLLDYVRSAVAREHGPVLRLTATDTPLKRQRMIEEEMPTECTSSSVAFSERRQL